MVSRTGNVLSIAVHRSFQLHLLPMVLLLASAFAGCGVVPPPGPSLEEMGGLIRVPLVHQNKNYTCGVAALQSVLYYYGRQFSQDYLEEQLGSSPETGTSASAIANFVRSLDLTIAERSDISLTALQQFLDQGTPVILLIQAWAAPGIDYTSEWDKAHYVVAIGYDTDNVYFMDPATLGHYTFIPIDDFLDRWHVADAADTQYNHFGIIISNTTPAYDWQSIVLLP